MRARILNLWDTFRSSFWFTPLLFVVLAVVLGLGMPVVDSRMGDWITQRVPWLTTTTAAARPSLSAIGGAMITVMGVVFSVTVVTLSITSSQFGSRLLRTFMDDLVTQFTIGIFVGTSLYCFLIMRAVREINGTPFIPHVSVGFSVLMAMGSMGVLIYFIHHIALAIQAPQLLAALAEDLDGAIDRMFPERIGQPPQDESPHEETDREDELPDAAFAPLIADREGYFQGIDKEGLLRLATENDLVIALTTKPGEFIVRETQVARIWPFESLSDELTTYLNGTLIVGSRRTPRQDVLCAVDEIVEVAVRALSPGINDPFTAVTCIDRLGASLNRLAGRQVPSPFRYDQDEQLRLIAYQASFVDVLDFSFSQIRQYGRSSVTVMHHLMRSLGILAEYVHRSEDRDSLLREAERIVEGFELANHQACDREALETQYERLMTSFEIRSKQTNREGDPNSANAADDAPSEAASASGHARDSHLHDS